MTMTTAIVTSKGRDRYTFKNTPQAQYQKRNKVVY